MCHLTDMYWKSHPVLKINALREVETVGGRQRVIGKRGAVAISSKSTAAGAEALTFCQKPAPSDRPPLRRMARSDNQQQRRCAQGKYPKSLLVGYAPCVLKLVPAEGLRCDANQSITGGVKEEERQR